MKIDKKLIKELVENLKEFGLTELEYQEGQTKIKVSKSGKDDKQGVGYLDDGTMVVIDNGKKHISEFVDIIITSVIQTPTGRMIFSKVGDLHD